MEKLNLGGAEQMDYEREVAEGHERWLDGTKKTLFEKHPDLTLMASMVGAAGMAVGGAFAMEAAGFKGPEAQPGLIMGMPLSFVTMGLFSRGREILNRDIDEGTDRGKIWRKLHDKGLVKFDW